MSQINHHTLFDYLNYASTLTPSSDELKEVTNTEWWTVVSEHFDYLIWQHYFDRTVLFNMKYPYDPSDPNNSDNMDATVAQIIFAFSINLRSKARMYEKLYKTYVAEYDPLYNVDAYEYEDRSLDQTGTDTTTKTGDDTAVRSGNSEMEKLGSEKNVRSGNETLGHTGSDTTLNQKTTYDSATLYDTDKSTITPGVTDTTTYNDVTDTSSFTNRKDKTTYNNVQDKTTYNTSDVNSKNLHDVEHIAKRRFGNIGVTRADQLLQGSREETLSFDFIKMVVHDCVNTCTYMVD